MLSPTPARVAPQRRSSLDDASESSDNDVLKQAEDLLQPLASVVMRTDSPEPEDNGRRRRRSSQLSQINRDMLKEFTDGVDSVKLLGTCWPRLEPKLKAGPAARIQDGLGKRA